MSRALERYEEHKSRAKKPAPQPESESGLTHDEKEPGETTQMCLQCGGTGYAQGGEVEDHDMEIEPGDENNDGHDEEDQEKPSLLDIFARRKRRGY